MFSGGDASAVAAPAFRPLEERVQGVAEQLLTVLSLEGAAAAVVTSTRDGTGRPSTSHITAVPLIPAAASRLCPRKADHRMASTPREPMGILVSYATASNQSNTGLAA